MDSHRPSHTAAFNTLPIELNKAIAHCLDTDKDICTFRRICRETNYAVDGDQLSFWRMRFREKFAFEQADPTTNIVLKKAYQSRMKWLKYGATEDFHGQGHGKNERKLMHVLRSLVLESYKGPHGYDEVGRPLCPNQGHLIEFIRNSRSFLSIKPLSPSGPKSKETLPVSPELTAIQIMCGQLLFHVDGMKYDIFSFEDSQKMVYSHYRNEPIFKGYGNLQVNMEWTLHCLNFFRHHMIREEAQSLYDTMQELDIGDRPSAWRTPLKDYSCPLNKYWKGTYAYLHQNELARLRNSSNGKKGRNDEIFEDKNIELGGNIQELKLDFVRGDELMWPPEFESRLQSLRETMEPRTRAQHRAPKTLEEPQSIRLVGTGVDQRDSFYASGWLNPLAVQQGIPGWQRITLMKHFDDDLDTVLDDDLWAYEGVVLPGGRLIFGRWWFASDEPDQPEYGRYSGPFILWAVDPPPTLDNDNDHHE